MAANGMVFLRNEMVEKRTRRDELSDRLDEATDELARIEKQCNQEKELRETCRGDIARMQEDTEKAQKQIIHLRAEMKQSTYFQENVDTETMYRLRADVQNLKTEREIDGIKLRQLREERCCLESELADLKALKDAHEIVAADHRREISELKMTREMYSVHNEALSMHLQSLGGDPNPKNKFGSFTMGARDSVRGFLQGYKILDLANDALSTISSKRDGEDKRKGIQQQQHDRRKSIPQSSVKSKQSRHVGGVVTGADFTAGEGSADYLRKLPTIFKMGGNSNETTQEYVARKEREVEFTSDSHSVSGISAITCDEDAWWDIDSETES